MRYAYYPGCSLKSVAVEYDAALKAVCEKLGVTLDEIDDWACCGATPAHAVDRFLSVALPARNLATAQKAGNDVMVACAACYNRMKVANHEIATDGALRKEVNEALGTDYDGGVKVLHLIEVLVNGIGIDKLKERVTKRLDGLKVACYYGCLLLRPPKVMHFDDPENPTSMDRLIEVTGAVPISWEFKTECCGAAMGIARTDIVHKLCGRILSDAKNRGAEMIAVACPLCQSNLDLRQSDVEKDLSREFRLPVLYFVQVLGLALGIDAKSLGLDKLIVDPIPLLTQKGVI